MDVYVEYAEAFLVGYRDQAGRYLQLFVTAFLFYSESEFSLRQGGSWNSGINLCYISAFKNKKYVMVSSIDSSLLLFLSL